MARQRNGQPASGAGRDEVERAPKRAAIYTRKSTSAGLERDFNSLDAQRDACESYAKSQSWRVAGSYDDGGFTGANIERPAFQRLLADIDAGQVDVVVVYKVDRLSRSLLDFARVMERFSARGVAFVSVTQHFSTADAIGRLTLNMLMSFAEFEREMIAERTRDKIVAARRKGKWTGGTVPVGYSVADHKLVKSATDAHVIQEIFELYSKYESVLAVVRDLRDRKRGRRDGAWTKDAVLRVLKNPLYAGLVAAGGELFPAEHEAIISREQFEETQTLLDAPSRLPYRGKNPAYLLRGVIHCAACGAAMTPGGSRRYRYYRCVTRDKLGARACRSKPLVADAIERFVLQRLRAVASDKRNVVGLVSRVTRQAAAERAALVAERTRLATKVAKASLEAQKLLESIHRLSGRGLEAAQRRLEVAANAHDEATGNLNSLERAIASAEASHADVAWMERALGNFDAIWELMTPDNRQRLFAALVDRIDVDEAAGRFELRLTLATEAA
jgi:DNA invertase Pin-like site-specific DNA recombinase